jgi:2-amino-4-hydroxy-6-hydroxymethyldihydropteridine diphosphokinase
MSLYTYHLSMGSNLGDRLAQLKTAKELIISSLGPVVTESSVYETQPWGFEDQPWFLNQSIAVTSALEPREVLHLIKQIEIKTGRTPSEKWHARHIDIDILLAGDKVMEEEDLQIPHPHFHKRNFALVPLMEIASQMMHPILQKTIEDLYLECRDTGEVYIFNADEQDNPL